MSLLYQSGGINVNFTLDIKIKKCFLLIEKEYFLIKLALNQSLSTIQLQEQGITIYFYMNFKLNNFRFEKFQLKARNFPIYCYISLLNICIYLVK